MAWNKMSTVHLIWHLANSRLVARKKCSTRSKKKYVKAPASSAGCSGGTWLHGLENRNDVVRVWETRGSQGWEKQQGKKTGARRAENTRYAGIHFTSIYFHSFIYSHTYYPVNGFSLSIYYVLNTNIGIRDTVISKTEGYSLNLQTCGDR